MTINEEILDSTIRHMVWTERYKTSQVKKIVALLNRADDDLVEQIAARMVKIEARGYDLGPATTERLESLLKSIREQRAEIAKTIYETSRDELFEFAAYEADFQSRIITGSVAQAGVTIEMVAPSASQLKSAVTKKPFQGRLLRDWYRDLGASSAKRVSDAVNIGIVEGQTTDQIVRRIKGTRARQYRDGILEIGRRDAQAIVRTAVAHVSARAQDELYAANDDIIKGVKWVSTLDSRTSSICRARDGKVFPVDSGPRPPAHFNCLTGDALVLPCGRIAGASKRWFDGEVVVIKTAAGKELTCTPNHPILTRRGWVGAGLLDVGDDVVSYAVGEGPALIDRDGKNIESPIHEVVKAFFGSGKVVAVPVPMTAKDFHGDGANSKVAIIGADRELRGELYAFLQKHGIKFSLMVRATTAPFLGALKCHSYLAHFFNATLSAASGFVRFCCQTLSFFGRSASHTSRLLFRSASYLQTVPFQEPLYCGGGATVFVGDSFHADTRIEKADNLAFVIDGHFLNCAKRGVDTGIVKRPVDSVDTDTKLAGDILNGSTGAVLFDKIVGTKRVGFSGHVYNLETEKSYYLANGIITHNCRSRVIPYLGPSNIKGTRASQFGPVPDDVTYSDWLKKQPVAIQNEVLGVKKAQLFRRGGLSLDRFQDASGREYTLSELKRRDSETWNKVFKEE